MQDYLLILVEKIEKKLLLVLKISLMEIMKQEQKLLKEEEVEIEKMQTMKYKSMLMLLSELVFLTVLMRDSILESNIKQKLYSEMRVTF